MISTIEGNGQQKRSFLFVNDAVYAIDIVMHKSLSNEIYNIGSHDKVTIKDLAALLYDICRKVPTEEDVIYIEDRIVNDTAYDISCDKIKSLGWRQKTGLVDGLRQTRKYFIF